MTVARIEISTFVESQPIGAWRAEFLSARNTELCGHSIIEKATATGAAVLLNVGLLLALRLDVSQLQELLSRRTGSYAGSQVMNAFFIDSHCVPEPVQLAFDPALPLRTPHIILPSQFPNFDIAEGAVGDAARSVGAVATAISFVSPEHERQRLRAVYREQLETYLAQHVAASPAEGFANCVVRLRQSAIGDILDVKIVDCDVSISEKSVLTSNIERAAPLPLPPRTDIFETELVVTFGKRVDVQL